MKPDLEELLDLHGGRLETWPDVAAAQDVRVRAMRDPEFRQALDTSRASDRAMAALGEEMAMSSQLNARFAAIQTTLTAQVAAQAERRRAFSRNTLMRLAASAVIACGLGVGAGQLIPEQTTAQADAYHELLLGANTGQFVDERQEG